MTHRPRRVSSAVATLAAAAALVLVAPPTSDAMTAAPAAAPVVTAPTAAAPTPYAVARRAGRAVNRQHHRVARHWATRAAARRMFDLRSQGFRWARPTGCDRRDGAWYCLTPMATATDPVPHQVANLVVRRAGGHLRVVAVSGLD